MLPFPYMESTSKFRKYLFMATKKDELPQLAQNMRRIMGEMGFNASDLSKKSGVSVASLSRILGGQVNPGINHISAISKALEVSIDSLVLPNGVHAVTQKYTPDDSTTKQHHEEASLRSETDILVSFILEDTDYTPNEAARLLANAATASWVHSWTQDLVDTENASYPKPTIAMQVGHRKISVDVAFPESLFEEGSIVSLISVITASCTSTGARVDDIRIPPVLLRTYSGPSFGVQGLRDKTQKYGRPLLSATMRPITGLSPRMFANAVFETLKGGVDITCDPTLLHSVPSNNWRDRFNYVSEAVSDAQYYSDELKLHAANVTASTVEEMLLRAEYAAEHGTHAVMVDSGAVGWSGVQSLAKFCQENKLTLCALGGRALHNGPLSQQLVAKLLRFAGADIVSVGSPLRGTAMARRNVKGITRSLEAHNMPAFPEGLIMFDQPTCGIQASWPACGGGHNAWHFPQLIDALGNDIIIQCGGSTMGHPWGSLSGATANRVALEALIQARIAGKNLAADGRNILQDAAKNSPELKEALQYWKEGAFLFGVISNNDKANLDGVIIKDKKKTKLKSIDTED